ncbi:MAG: tetratricopeptide repeat protein, partial [Myxococcota bacterium]
VALRALEGAYLASRNWAGLAAVHVREAAAATQAGHRAGLLVRAAELHEERLEDHVEATRFYDLALQSDPTHLSALRGRRRLAERDGDTMRALELLAREGELLADEREASELVFEAGRMRQDELGDVDGAIAAYEEVLEQEPSHLGAFNRLEMIFLDRDDAPRVRALLSGRARAVDDGPERARLLVSAGRVAEERLRDRNAAINDYRAALEHEPRSADALVRLGPLLMNERRWSEAVEVFHQTLAVSRESTILRDTFKSLGVIYQEHQQDLVKSVQSFQAALRADPRDTESLYRLAELYRGVEDWSSAINVTLRLAEVEQDADGKTKALRDLAELYLTGPGDSALAIAALRKAVEIEPGCRPALLRLCELHEQREEWSELTEA